LIYIQERSTAPSVLDENFYILGWVLLPTLIVMGLAIKKYLPPMPSLFAGVVAGGATAMIVQGQSLQSIFYFANSGYSINTGIGEIDSLLNQGGIQSMMWTISLILITLDFGGALEKTGCLKRLLMPLRVKSVVLLALKPLRLESRLRLT
jgi:NhaC family Na+:H+ antiporter